MFITTYIELYSKIRRKNGENCYMINYDLNQDFFIKINNQNLIDFGKLYEEIITKAPTYGMFNLTHVRLRKMTMSSSRHLPPTIKTLEIYHLIRDCDISEFIIPESVEQLYICNGLKTKDKIVLPRSVIKLMLFDICVSDYPFIFTAYWLSYNNERYIFYEYNIKPSEAKLIFYRNIKIPTSVQYIEDELITDDNGNNNCNNNCNNNGTTVMGHQKHKIQDKLNILVQIFNKYYNGQFYIPREYINNIIDRIEYHDIDDILCKKILSRFEKNKKSFL